MLLLIAAAAAAGPPSLLHSHVIVHHEGPTLPALIPTHHVSNSVNNTLWLSETLLSLFSVSWRVGKFYNRKIMQLSSSVTFKKGGGGSRCCEGQLQLWSQITTSIMQSSSKFLMLTSSLSPPLHTIWEDWSVSPSLLMCSDTHTHTQSDTERQRERDIFLTLWRTSVWTFLLNSTGSRHCWQIWGQLCFWVFRLTSLVLRQLGHIICHSKLCEAKPKKSPSNGQMFSQIVRFLFIFWVSDNLKIFSQNPKQSFRLVFIVPATLTITG